LLIRSGSEAAPQPVLLVRDGQTVAAGRCDQALSVNAGAVGYYRALYDPATLRANTAQFSRLPSGDRIALLDDQWALVESGEQPLASYLALAAAMGGDLNERAWSQIAAAFDVIEYDARGMPGHDAFAAYARALLKPVADRLGWDAHAGETAGIQKLRRTLIAALGQWGDDATISEARRRFAAFRADRNALRVDEQGVVLSIVARYADAASFEQLRALARSAANETELRRYYTALMDVRDARLAADAVTIALSKEIPPQADGLRVDLIDRLQHEHPLLAWDAFTAHSEQLIAPLQPFGALQIAQYTPETYWNSLPVDQLEAWVKAHSPAEMNLEVARGMETAHFRLDLKARLGKAISEFAAPQS
jgi:aminopeptidase N